jgi:hypothetical protein
MSKSAYEALDKHELRQTLHEEVERSAKQRAFRRQQAAQAVSKARTHSQISLLRSIEPMVSDPMPVSVPGGDSAMELDSSVSVAGAVRNAAATARVEDPRVSNMDTDGKLAHGDSNSSRVLSSSAKLIITKGSLSKRFTSERRVDKALSKVNKAGLYELDEKDFAKVPSERHAKGDELYYWTNSTHDYYDVRGDRATSHGGLFFGPAGRFFALDNITKVPHTHLGIPDGTGHRETDQVVVRRLRCRGSLDFESFKNQMADAGDTTTMIRIMVVYDKNPRGTFPNSGDLLDDWNFESWWPQGPGPEADDARRHYFGGGAHPLSLRQRRNRRFVVLGDVLKVCNVSTESADNVTPALTQTDGYGHPNDATMEFNFDIHSPEGLVLEYIENSHGGLPESKIKGAFYLFCIGNGRGHNFLMDHATAHAEGSTWGAGFQLNKFKTEIAFTEVV